MKNPWLLSLFLFLLLGIGLITYQNKHYDVLRKDTEESVMEQVEKLWNTRFSISREIESSEKTKNFIFQQEQLRELSDYFSDELDDYRRQDTQNLNRVEQFLSLSLDNLALKDSEYEKMLQEYIQVLAETGFLQKQLLEKISILEARIVENKNKIQDYRKNLEESLTQAQESLSLKQQDDAQRFLEFEKKLVEFRELQKQESMQIQELRQQLEERKNQPTEKAPVISK
ncbi:MAG: hypothetical protein ABIG46_06370 [Candidatus Omnitrophota bacterium]|nr:hypothetical protein [Candidatus Omnitrophota bacterium]